MAGSASMGMSRYRGVAWETRASKWRVQIWANGRQVNLGYFVDEEDAARLRDSAAVHLGMG